MASQENDWIDHDGVAMPVDRNTLVDIEFALGTTGKHWGGKQRQDPTNWEWVNGRAPLDIARYRVSA